jgi:hypothetical protein
MTDVRKAKVQLQLSEAENYKRLRFYMMPQLLILLEENYSEVQLYETYNKNAQIRFDGIKSLIKAGDKRRSSSVEAGISLKKQISLEDSQLKLNKAKLII